MLWGEKSGNVDPGAQFVQEPPQTQLNKLGKVMAKENRKALR